MSMTFKERCAVSQQSLPESLYRDALMRLHDEMLARIADLQAQAKEDEKSLDDALRDRDEWHDRATRLAEAVGEWFGVDVGEHSSANCPIEEAHKVLNGEYVSPKLQAQVTRGKAEALEDVAEGRYELKLGPCAAQILRNEARRLREGGVMFKRENRISPVEGRKYLGCPRGKRPMDFEFTVESVLPNGYISATDSKAGTLGFTGSMWDEYCAEGLIKELPTERREEG